MPHAPVCTRCQVTYLIGDPGCQEEQTYTYSLPNSAVGANGTTATDCALLGQTLANILDDDLGVNVSVVSTQLV